MKTFQTFTQLAVAKISVGSYVRVLEPCLVEGIVEASGLGLSLTSGNVFVPNMGLSELITGRKITVIDDAFEDGISAYMNRYSVNNEGIWEEDPEGLTSTVLYNNRIWLPLAELEFLSGGYRVLSWGNPLIDEDVLEISLSTGIVVQMRSYSAIEEGLRILNETIILRDEVADDLDDTSTYASMAGTSADKAETSADEAEDSAKEAKGHSWDARTYSVTSGSFANQASSSAGSASSSANSASNSASSASSSANSASNSAVSAAESAASAAESAAGSGQLFYDNGVYFSAETKQDAIEILGSNYYVINQILGDKYEYGPDIDDADKLDAQLGAIYYGTASEEEIEGVYQINYKLGLITG